MQILGSHLAMVVCLHPGKDSTLQHGQRLNPETFGTHVCFTRARQDGTSFSSCIHQPII